MKVKDFLTADNWGQGDECGNDDRQECIMTAVGYCYPEETGEFYKLRARIVEYLGTNDIVGWNDTPGRTFEEVKAVVVALDI